MVGRLEKIINKIPAIMQNTFKIRSIQSVIALSFAIITILAMFFVGITLYNMFSGTAETNASSSTEQIMNQVNFNLENYLKGMMEISGLITDEFKSDMFSGQDNMKSLFDLTAKIRKDVVTLAVFTKSGPLILSSPSKGYNTDFKINEQDWFGIIGEQPDKYLFLPPHVQRMFEEKRPWVVSLCRSVTTNNYAGKETYITQVDMNFSTIDELCRSVSLGKRGYIYIIDTNGRLIYHPQQQIVYAGLKSENTFLTSNRADGSYFESFQGERRLVTIKTIAYTNWKMVGISYVDELVATKNKIKYFFLFVLIFGIMFVILASVFISAKISQPIIKLQKLMEKVEKGDFDINIDVKGEDEVKNLSKTFNIMVSRIRDLMDQIIKEQEAKTKSELKALQAQINPHFLYNTLDSIVWMNENRKYDGVTTMVAALAKLFRISISRGNELISIQDELEHARSYLTIQKIRYKNKFDFTINAQPEILKYKTLKLILQPIIENAIYHGIEHIHEKGRINVIVTLSNDKVMFRIIDNGYGIKPDILKGILDKESTDDPGVGLNNVHQRIQLYFGKEYGLKVESELDIGTTVEIRIPICKQEDREQKLDNIVYDKC